MNRIITIFAFVLLTIAATGVFSSSFAAVFQVGNASQLHSALLTAQNNGQNDTIRIAQGTYTGNFIYTSYAAEDLTLQGGWQSNFSSRTVKAENTVLDGNHTGGVFVFSCDNNSNLTIDGITFQNGSADEQHGGGIFIFNLGGQHEPSTITISNSAIKNNSANELRTVTYGGGAGVYIRTYAKVVIKNNFISGNIIEESGKCGGAVIDTGEEIDIIGNVVENNKGGNFGGGMCVISSYRRVHILNNVFAGNEAVNKWQGSTYTETSGQGGGLYAFIYTLDTPTIISGNIFSRNKAGRYGGGLNLKAYGDRVDVTNNRFTENMAYNEFRDYQGYKTGGGVLIDFSGNRDQTVNFVNNTVAGNLAGDQGGGIHVRMGQDGATFNMYNTVFWDNSSVNPGHDIFIDNDADNNYLPGICNLHNNDFNKSTLGMYLDIPFAIHSSNLNNKDPLFAAAWDGNYMLSPGSPCLNRGNNNAPALPTTDLKGRPRIQDGIVDMGAYEGTDTFRAQLIMAPFMLLLEN